MSKTHRHAKIGIFKNIQTLTVCAMLTAMSVAIGIFCKNFLDFGGGLFRITFENLPILLSGIMFGPIVGGAVGLCTDIVSYLLSGQIYPMNLIVTFGALMVGVVSGFFSKYVIKRKSYFRIIVSCLLAHFVGSLIIKPIGLFAYYGWAVLWRFPIYLLAIIPLEVLLICTLYRNSYVRNLIDGGLK